jgi:hypothetical protein
MALKKQAPFSAGLVKIFASSCKNSFRKNQAGE